MHLDFNERQAQGPIKTTVRVGLFCLFACFVLVAILNKVQGLQSTEYKQASYLSSGTKRCLQNVIKPLLSEF